jgi:hypothetical protein
MTGNLKPVRIQRRRVKGFNLDAESRKVNGLPVKVVTRPSDYGNPFRVGDMLVWGDDYLYINKDNCLFFFEQWAKQQAEFHPHWLEPLRGHNLACFCPLTDKDGKAVPCHAEILLKLIREKYGE